MIFEWEAYGICQRMAAHFPHFSFLFSIEPKLCKGKENDFVLGMWKPVQGVKEGKRKRIFSLLLIEKSHPFVFSKNDIGVSFQRNDKKED